jgi:hypothetical protein
MPREVEKGPELRNQEGPKTRHISPHDGWRRTGGTRFVQEKGRTKCMHTRLTMRAQYDNDILWIEKSVMRVAGKSRQR